MKVFAPDLFVQNLIHSLEKESLLVLTEEESISTTSDLIEIINDSQKLSLLKSSRPDIIISTFPGKNPPEVQSTLQSKLGYEVRVFYPAMYNFESLLNVYEEVGVALGSAAEGRNISQRIKAQFMDWADNFYPRTKNKKVTFLSSITPLKLAGFWIPDLIKQVSCTPQNQPGESDKSTTWEDIYAFRPDVIVVAPKNFSLEESCKLLLQLEKQPLWEKIPAVLRGEVSFIDGKEHFYHPSLKIIESMGILLSAIAGFDSGYITPRESFFRLRWLELNRHKL